MQSMSASDHFFLCLCMFCSDLWFMLWQVILLTCCLTSSFHFLLKKNLCFNDILPRCLRYLLFLNQVNVDFFFTYSQTCIKRCPFWTKTSGLIKQVTSVKRFNTYEIFYDRTRKKWGQRKKIVGFPNPARSVLSYLVN